MDLSKILMRMKGLEPSHLAVPEPKSGASANSATSACLCRNYFFNLTKILSVTSSFT